jgi:hypothetical protein
MRQKRARRRAVPRRPGGRRRPAARRCASRSSATARAGLDSGRTSLIWARTVSSAADAARDSSRADRRRLIRPGPRPEAPGRTGHARPGRRNRPPGGAPGCPAPPRPRAACRPQPRPHRLRPDQALNAPIQAHHQTASDSANPRYRPDPVRHMSVSGPGPLRETGCRLSELARVGLAGQMTCRARSAQSSGCGWPFR